MHRITFILLVMILLPMFSYAELAGGDVDSYILKGQMFEDRKDFVNSREALLKCYFDATPFYEKAVKSDPDNPDANLLLARAYISTERYKKVVRLLEAYLALQPEDKYAHLYLGEAYCRLGNYTQAEKILKRGISLLKEHKTHSSIQYRYYSYASSWDEFAPLDDAMYYYLVVTLKELKKYDEADTYQKLITSPVPR